MSLRKEARVRRRGDPVFRASRVHFSVHARLDNPAASQKLQAESNQFFVFLTIIHAFPFKSGAFVL